MCSKSLEHGPWFTVRSKESRQDMLSEGKGLPCVICKKVITDMPYEFMFYPSLSSVKDSSGNVRSDVFDWNNSEHGRKYGYACSRECHLSATGQNPVEESKG